MMDYNICSKCIMDTTDPDIIFNESGVCNHCLKYQDVASKKLFKPVEREKKLNELVSKIKESGKNKKYDCIIGVSGGVDSTYIAYLTKELGIRPLAVHLDNGWNSELSVSNIEKTLKTLNIDLYTYVIDWEEFKDIQLSFLKASTPDSEIPTDHAISAILFSMASKLNIKYILLGTNVVTESILPLKWGYGYYDFKYIKNIQKKFGSKKIKTFPHFNLLKLFYFLYIRKLKMISILNYIDYDKPKAMHIIQKQLGWVYYGGKHYESIYTRFFQSYILPRKFNIDKRKAHYSNLINSGQMSRVDAMLEMHKPVAPDSIINEDKEFTIKKFGLTESEFEKIMLSPTKLFLDYKTNYQLFESIKKIIKLLK